MNKSCELCHRYRANYVCENPHCETAVCAACSETVETGPESDYFIILCDICLTRFEDGEDIFGDNDMEGKP